MYNADYVLRIICVRGKQFSEIPRGTRGIRFSFPDPQGIANCHTPIPRGVKIAGDLASLCVVLQEIPPLLFIDRDYYGHLLAH